jgi:kynureninase
VGAWTRADAERADAADPLAGCRARFELDPSLIYLDGNSLGPLPTGVAARLQQLVSEEWGRGLVRSWNQAGWVDLAERVGAKLARLVGAAESEVVVADSTSVNLYKALGAALAAAGPGDVLTDDGNFPTDLYIAEAAARQFGGRRVRRVPRAELLGAIRPGTALVTTTHVDYRSGHLLDLAAVTEAAHRVGALAVWDLCHSVGAVPIDLSAAGADLAVGCTYKYLNGGPGSPAFVYVAGRHRDLRSPVSGWFGHEDTFAFGPEYRPAAGAARFQAGTPPILAVAALEVAMDVFADIDMSQVRAKSAALGELLISLAEERCREHGIGLASPRDAASRGSHVSLTHPDAYEIVQALAAAGVIVDSRPPDLIRFGLGPLYTRFVDVWDAIQVLGEVLESGRHVASAHSTRHVVP